MNDTRYIYRTDALTGEEARDLREKDIRYSRERIDYILGDLREAEQQLQELMNSPLPTHVTVQVTLNPGDEGYENAPVRMDPAKYLGDLEWLTTAHQ